MIKKRHQTHDWTLIGSGANEPACKSVLRLFELIISLLRYFRKISEPVEGYIYSNILFASPLM